MNIFRNIYRCLLPVLLLSVCSCDDKLTEINENPNGIDPSNANPNLMMPTVMTTAAIRYLDLGFNNVAGVVQHTQKTGWYDEHNVYNWSPQSWDAWYGMLRTNSRMQERAVALNWKFHEAVALTMKSFIFGVVTDLWGDAPYKNGVKGNQGTEYVLPAFDSQEVIYDGIIEDLKRASELFASGDKTGVIDAYDVYFGGKPDRWQKFANSLLLRYYMRISSKKADVAKAGIEAVYQSGIYMKTSADDAVMDFLGTAKANSWETGPGDDGLNFRNRKPATTLLNKLAAYNDPRREVWFSPVHVKWVADPGLSTAVDQYIRKDGVIMTGVESIKDKTFRENPGNYTRHFNPNLYTGTLSTDDYVAIPPGIALPDAYNGNPTTGQILENQHVSQLADIYREAKGTLLKARLMSAAETSFILAEAAEVKSWNAGTAETHYNNGILQSLTAWGVAGQYGNYIAVPGVKYNKSLSQIIEQKWIASWTAATEAWFDFRRTGYPELKPGPAAPEAVLPIRFMYSDTETLLNGKNADQAIANLQATPYSRQRGNNSQWSKPWIIIGTGKPW